MLGAFFGPQYRDWWFDYVKDPEYITPYANHWLVRRSASAAFAGGFVHLQRLNSSMIEVSKRKPDYILVLLSYQDLLTAST